MADKVSLYDKVTTTATTDWNGGSLWSGVRENTYYVQQIGGEGLSDERIVIGDNAAPPAYPHITAAVHINTLTVVEHAGEPVIPEHAETEEVEAADPEEAGDSVDTQAAIADLVDKAGQTKADNTATIQINGESVVIDLDERSVAEVLNESNWWLTNDAPKKVDPYVSQFLQGVNTSAPWTVQNEQGFPPAKGIDSKGIYYYDYSIDYAAWDDATKWAGFGSDSGLFSRLCSNSYKSVNIDIRNRRELTKKYTEAYNKFKTLNPNDALAKTFSHVFFIRPDCNIFDPEEVNARLFKLSPALNDLSEFYYARQHCPDILRQLTQDRAMYDHEFALFLSNKARSMEIADEFISSETYGDSLTGYKVAYGRHNVESKTANKFTVHYIDDRDLNVYQLHKLWIDYISYVYRGKVPPEEKYLINKVLDYPTCVYYIVCAEDGESIIFWSKFWGVFPTNAPSSTFSWSAENTGGVSLPSFNIEYQYSWKEDFNPLSLVEFNQHVNTKKKGFEYIPNYIPGTIGSGYAFGGTPFVETFTSESREIPYTFKLRFRPLD